MSERDFTFYTWRKNSPPAGRYIPQQLLMGVDEPDDDDVQTGDFWMETDGYGVPKFLWLLDPSGEWFSVEPRVVEYRNTSLNSTATTTLDIAALANPEVQGVCFCGIRALVTTSVNQTPGSEWTLTIRKVNTSGTVTLLEAKLGTDYTTTPILAGVRTYVPIFIRDVDSSVATFWDADSEDLELRITKSGVSGTLDIDFEAEYRLIHGVNPLTSNLPTAE